MALSTPAFQEGVPSHSWWTASGRSWGSLSGSDWYGTVGNPESYPVHSRIHGLVPIDYESSFNIHISLSNATYITITVFNI